MQLSASKHMAMWHFILHVLDDLWNHLRYKAACGKYECESTQPDASSMFVALGSDAFTDEILTVLRPHKFMKQM